MVPNHIMGTIAAPTLIVNVFNSFDFRDLTMRVNRTIMLPKASMMPINSINRVEIGLAKNCCLRSGRVNKTASASLAGKVSIFPMAMAYFPWFWELKTFMV